MNANAVTDDRAEFLSEWAHEIRDLVLESEEQALHEAEWHDQIALYAHDIAARAAELAGRELNEKERDVLIEKLIFYQNRSIRVFLDQGFPYADPANIGIANVGEIVQAVPDPGFSDQDLEWISTYSDILIRRDPFSDGLSVVISAPYDYVAVGFSLDDLADYLTDEII